MNPSMASRRLTRDCATANSKNLFVDKLLAAARNPVVARSSLSKKSYMEKMEVLQKDLQSFPAESPVVRQFDAMNVEGPEVRKNGDVRHFYGGGCVAHSFVEEGAVPKHIAER